MKRLPTTPTIPTTIPTTPTIPTTIPTTPTIPTTIQQPNQQPSQQHRPYEQPFSRNQPEPMDIGKIEDEDRVYKTYNRHRRNKFNLKYGDLRSQKNSFNQPLLIKTLQHQIYVDEKAIVPVFEEFSDTEKGNDILRPLNDCINYGKTEITIGNKTLPMHFEDGNLNKKRIIAPDNSDLVYYKEEKDGKIVREGILNVEMEK
ncbi:unnamed protein product [Ceratitis capitata]|uniref:(Mediterranean fruit fly) hypothetical protein n=1 Tax=Ceratitis capitata TaxID=7213 RepID=A0A811UWJ0_CERCA|nr:unnamed protein product [Ceratitis capitata]